MRTRNVLLTGWILLAVALPAAAQTTLGVRAGAGIARMDLDPGDEVFATCPPGEPCPGLPTDPAYSFTFGADLTVPLALEYEIRVGGTYAVKGGAGLGSDANGEPLSGRLSVGYVQLSSLLGVRFSGRPLGRLSVSVLAGPWVALRLWCGGAGRQNTGCASFDPDTPDAGVAVGGGLEAALSSRLSLGVEAIYYHGLTSFSYQTTRFVAIQAGVVVPVG